MSSNIKYVIIEDEQNSRELLAGLLATYVSGMENGGYADNVAEGIKLLDRTAPDLIFLDIEMPDANGFDLLDHVKPAKQNVIFVTGYDKYAIRAIKYSALDYLLKPVDVTELQQAVERFKKITPDNSEGIGLFKSYLSEKQAVDRIIIHHKRGHLLLHLKDIVSISTVEGYALFHTLQGQKYIAAHTLAYYEELLPDTFFRIHKSAIINLSHIEKYEQGRTGKVHMCNGDSFEIAARRKSQFLSVVGNIKLA